MTKQRKQVNPMNNYKIGSFIAKKRKEQNLKQKDLAEKLFVTSQAVSRWENGDVEPSISTLQSLSDIFNVSIDS
jgi:transcriptional regulator with XRE-family HTH domain